MNVFQSFIHTLQLQRDRWILWTPAPLAFGIGVYFALPSEPPAYLGITLFGAALAAAWPLRGNKAALLLWLPFFLAALGFGAAQFRAWEVRAPVLHKKTHQPLTVTGRVVDVDPLDKSYRVTLDTLSFEGGDAPQKHMPERVRIRLKKNDPADPREGDTVTLKAMLTPLAVPVLPGAYDFQQYGYFHAIGSTGYALTDMKVTAPARSGYMFEGLRRAIRETIYADGLAPKNIEGLTVAFMTGDAGGITPKDWDTARQSGIAHLIAISGSHFAMIVGVVFFAVRALLAAVPRIALRWPVKKIAAAAGMAVAIFYTLLIGAPISAQRAAVMSCAIMLAIMLDRDPLTLRLAALAAFAVLLAEPESLVGPSFQMSFAAVIGLVAFFESGRDRWTVLYNEGGPARRVGLFLLGSFATTLVASLAVGPFTLYHFMRDPLMAGLLTNMIAVPLSSFVTFPLGLLACLLMPLGLEKAPLWVTERSIEVIMRVAETVAGWPHMALTADAWPVQYLVMFTLGGLWICLWRGRVRWLGLAPVLVAMLLIGLRPRPDALIGGNFKVLAAVKDEKGVLWLSPGRADKFVRAAWTEREGGAGTDSWPDKGRAGDILSCASHACLYTLKGHSILFVRDKATATAAECRAADIIVTPEAERPEKNCPATVIDKWSLYDDGTHVVTLKENTPPVIRTVADWRGERPWTGRRYKKPSENQ
jgi:competence protein ComEC